MSLHLIMWRFGSFCSIPNSLTLQSHSLIVPSLEHVTNKLESYGWNYPSFVMATCPMVWFMSLRYISPLIVSKTTFPSLVYTFAWEFPPTISSNLASAEKVTLWMTFYSMGVNILKLFIYLVMPPKSQSLS